MVLEGELELEIQGWTFGLGRGRGVDSGARAPYGRNVGGTTARL